MAVVVGTFGTRSQAEDAMMWLRQVGFEDKDFSLVSNSDEAVGAPPDAEQRANRTAEVATVGGAVGAVLGGALLGPVGAVLGGVAGGGGLAALLAGRGVTRDEAEEYEARLRAGRYALVVNVDDPAPPGQTIATVREALDRADAERVRVER